MKIKNVLCLIGLLLFLCCMNTSCSDDVYHIDGDYIEVESNKLTVGRILTSIDIEISTNLETIDVENHIGADWCNGEFKDGILTINISNNPSMDSRIGALLLKGGRVSQVISITQDGRNAGLSDLKDDIKLKVVSGTASSFHPTQPIENSFDGDLSTIYQIKWNTEYNFPVTLVYNLSGEEDVDYIIYTAYPQYASLKLLTLWDGKRRKIPKGFPRISCSIFR